MRSFPQADAPLVDPGSGRIERVWLDFLRDQFARIGGTGDASKAQPLSTIQDQAALALLSDNPDPDLTAVSGAISDLALLMALTPDPDPASPDQAALLALAIAD